MPPERARCQNQSQRHRISDEAGEARHSKPSKAVIPRASQPAQAVPDHQARQRLKQFRCPPNLFVIEAGMQSSHPRFGKILRGLPQQESDQEHPTRDLHSHRPGGGFTGSLFRLDIHRHERRGQRSGQQPADHHRQCRCGHEGVHLQLGPELLRQQKLKGELQPHLSQRQQGQQGDGAERCGGLRHELFRLSMPQTDGLQIGVPNVQKIGAECNGGLQGRQALVSNAG